MPQRKKRRPETDAWAIEKSLADPAAFVGVFERHFALLHRYLQVRAGESSADDLAAQTFEIAFRRRADYDTRRSDAGPWLFGIALNLLRDARRHERRQQHALERIGSLEADYDISLEQVDARVGAGAVRRALAEVPEEDRDLLLLYACADLRVVENLERMDQGAPPGMAQHPVVGKTGLVYKRQTEYGEVRVWLTPAKGGDRFCQSFEAPRPDGKTRPFSGAASRPHCSSRSRSAATAAAPTSAPAT